MASKLTSGAANSKGYCQGQDIDKVLFVTLYFYYEENQPGMVIPSYRWQSKKKYAFGNKVRC